MTAHDGGRKEKRHSLAHGSNRIATSTMRVAGMQLPSDAASEGTFAPISAASASSTGDQSHAACCAHIPHAERASPTCAKPLHLHWDISDAQTATNESAYQQ